MYDEEDPSTMIPILDGGTEGVLIVFITTTQEIYHDNLVTGFKGQSRIIVPRKTACYECSLDMQTKPTTFPICTIANTPRLPEHCIEWASVIQWPKIFPDTKIDGDDPQHIKWLLDTATIRANEFNINGVTYSLTQGVVKNIIPAIASTNAIIAASCANEAFKLLSNCAETIDNYMMYAGDSGVYTYTFQLDKKPNCTVCGSSHIKIEIDPRKTLEDLIDLLIDMPG
ncbi:hypothetical protein HK096_010739, partial [Nowakowskiella sp. JEL0078]